MRNAILRIYLKIKTQLSISCALDGELFGEKNKQLSWVPLSLAYFIQCGAESNY